MTNLIRLARFRFRGAVARTTNYTRAALLGACLGGILPLGAAAAPCATDDLGREVCLDQPAQRIAALSPGATELVFAAGAGDKVIAVVEFSDYPPRARDLPLVGSHARLDLEGLLALKPDLAIGWVTGNPQEQIDKLERLGLPVFLIEPRSFEGISTAIERLAVLAGTEDVGQAAADRFREGIRQLAENYKAAEPVTVFYQVWDEPLMTVNDEHLIGKVMELCGGVNVFGGLDRLVPRIGLEAVLAADPKAIITGGQGENNRRWLTGWERFPKLQAVQRNNLFFVPPSLIQRPTPRLLQGSRTLCQKLEQARARS